MKNGIVFSEHAKQRMKERNINESQINRTINKPEIGFAEEMFRKVSKKINKRELEVEYIENGKMKKVITVRWK